MVSPALQSPSFREFHAREGSLTLGLAAVGAKYNVGGRALALDPCPAAGDRRRPAQSRDDDVGIRLHVLSVRTGTRESGIGARDSGLGRSLDSGLATASGSQRTMCVAVMRQVPEALSRANRDAG